MAIAKAQMSDVSVRARTTGRTEDCAAPADLGRHEHAADEAAVHERANQGHPALLSEDEYAEDGHAARVEKDVGRVEAMAATVIERDGAGHDVSAVPEVDDLRGQRQSVR